MQLIPGHLGQHCPGGGGRGLVQGGRAHSTSLQSMGCGLKTACRYVVRNINDYGLIEWLLTLLYCTNGIVMQQENAQ